MTDLTPNQITALLQYLYRSMHPAGSGRITAADPGTGQVTVTYSYGVSYSTFKLDHARDLLHLHGHSIRMHSTLASEILRSITK